MKLIVHATDHFRHLGTRAFMTSARSLISVRVLFRACFDGEAKMTHGRRPRIEMMARPACDIFAGFGQLADITCAPAVDARRAIA